MSKQTLTKEIAAETKAILENEGEKVTAKAIRDRAGVGSYTTATRLLTELRAEENALLSMPEHVAGEYSRFQDFIWTAAMTEATRAFEADRTVLECDRDKAESLARERLSVIDELETEAAIRAERMQQVEERLNVVRRKVSDLERRFSTERTRAETLQSVVAAMTMEHRAPDASEKGNKASN